MDYFVEQGGTFLDTANAYSTGATESVIGRWLKARHNRDSLVIATKVFGSMGSGANDGGLSRIHIHQAVEASLRRLQTDVIDLYQIHRWDSAVPIEETIAALDDLVRQGKVRYVGCSNLRAYQLQYCLDYARGHSLHPFVSLQPPYNALNRAIEAELLPLCGEQGIGVITYNPLAGGMLTGKYRRDAPLPKGARLEAFPFYHDRYYTEEALRVVEHFLLEASKRTMSPAQLALAWVLAEPRISSPILGSRSLAQITDALKGAEIHLTPDERAAIPAVQAAHWVGEDPIYGR
jgi:aryl-alcohol dehydrogenase-like predicted oxidoreductase